MIDNVFTKRPCSQRSYESTLRLLITSRCEHNCFFCHNEGQDKSVQRDMDFDKITPYLKTLNKRFNSITVSGGEPLLHPGLDRIIHSLSSCNFDITLDTFGITPEINYGILEILNSLHVTILCLSSKGIYVKEVDNSKIKMLAEIHKELPRLNLCINIPFVRPEIQTNNFSDILDVARQLNSKIKFISEYDSNISRIDGSQAWTSRWESILPLLDENDFTLSEVNTREVEYIDRDGVIVELSDIACVNVDQGYSNGICFKNSDLTIQPDLSVKLCRWQNHHVSIEELLENDCINNDVLASLINACSSQCPYKIQSHPLINEGLAHYLFDKHYTWPLRDNTHNVNDKIKDVTEMTLPSYFGSSGSVRRLETQFAKRVNTKYAVAVNSGASALSLVYKSVGIKAGSEVIIPVFTYPGAVTPLLQIGANIRLCDVDESTGNISMPCLEKLVSKSTKAVVVTHLWGNPVDMQRLSQICKQYDIRIVEDASHAFNAKIHNKAIGSWGDVACFSLQANKAICAGEGGIISTNNKDIFEFVIAHGSLKKQILDSISNNNLKSIWETGLGVKQKIHPHAASMGLIYLELFDSFKKLKDKRLSIIRNMLKDIPYLQMSPQVTSSEREYYTIKLILDKKAVEYRSYIIEQMLKHGLDAKIPDFRPIHKSELLKNFNFYAKYFPDETKVLGINQNYIKADAYYDRLIGLPAFVTEEIELVSYYMETIKKIMREISSSLENIDAVG